VSFLEGLGAVLIMSAIVARSRPIPGLSGQQGFLLNPVISTTAIGYFVTVATSMHMLGREWPRIYCSDRPGFREPRSSFSVALDATTLSSRFLEHADDVFFRKGCHHRVRRRVWFLSFVKQDPIGIREKAFGFD
jgi:hypothetical protein